MRLIAACPRCCRQYDASDKPTGSVFRCHCGESITVAAPQGHEAAVVRCSSCGAPREKNAVACNFCGADFTVHEQDLDTVCPGCLALVSDRARFCHHCGLSIQPELAHGAETPLACPTCGPDCFLTSRYLGLEQVTALECQRCAGFWLGSEAFDKLLVRAVHDALPPGHLLNSARPKLPAMDRSEGWHYRPCPMCRQLMVRQSYGHGSGVIVDVCRGHGIWFDANELPRILDWVRTGGAERARLWQAQSQRTDEHSRWVSSIGSPPRQLAGGGRVGDAVWPEVLKALGRMFGR
ncbi:MAG: zf-TFIIB domain-containing protein [Planctomycetia bacterium]|nr:zf-TFIIB domain-containing protein [Planctomycetia bacterium]